MTELEQTYVRYMIESCQRIEDYTFEMSFEEFESEAMVQDAVLRHFNLIGYAAKSLKPEFRDANPHIPWDRVSALRTTLLQDFFGIDMSAVWVTIQEYLPEIEKSLEQLLNEKVKA